MLAEQGMKYAGLPCGSGSLELHSILKFVVWNAIEVWYNIRKSWKAKSLHIKKDMPTMKALRVDKQSFCHCWHLLWYINNRARAGLLKSKWVSARTRDKSLLFVPKFVSSWVAASSSAHCIARITVACLYVFTYGMGRRRRSSPCTAITSGMMIWLRSNDGKNIKVSGDAAAAEMTMLCI